MLARLFRKSPAKPSPLPLSPELLRAVHELEIFAQHRIAALLPGECRSAFRGSGMQFKEFRQYEPGDDIRHMSWTVTARTGKPTIRVYEEERELDIVCLVDISGSTLAGLGKTKHEMYAELTMLLGLAALKAGDNFGLCLFDNETRLYLSPKKIRHQVLLGVSRLLSESLEKRQSDIRPALHYLGNALSHRSLVVVLSDFLVPPFDSELRVLSHSHDVVLVQCFHDLERGHTIPAIFEARDPETGDHFLLDTHSRKNRKLLTHAQMQQMESLKSLAHRNNASFLPLSLQDDYFKRLILFFRHRSFTL